MKRPEGTCIVAAIGGLPYANISVDNIVMGSTKAHINTKYASKNNVLLVTCLQTGHVTLEMMDSCTRFSGLVWSDNFSSLCMDSHGPHLEKDFQVAMENLQEQNKKVRFHTNVSLQSKETLLRDR